MVGPRQANLILIAYASSESRGTFRQKARFLTSLNGWACAVKICHDGMLEDTNSLDGAQLIGCVCVYSNSDNRLMLQLFDCQTQLYVFGIFRFLFVCLFFFFR